MKIQTVRPYMTPPKLLLRASLQMSRSPKQPRSPKFPLRTVSLRPVDASPSTASPNGNNYSPAPAGLTVKEAIVMRTVNPSPLAERRIALGLTQAQLAEKSHINIRQVQKSKRANPTSAISLLPTLRILPQRWICLLTNLPSIWYRF